MTQHQILEELFNDHNKKLLKNENFNKMKKLIYVFVSLTFLVVTLSMITKNHTSNVQKANSSELSVRSDIVLEQRP
jgi:hypothetical protein